MVWEGDKTASSAICVHVLILLHASLYTYDADFVKSILCQINRVNMCDCLGNKTYNSSSMTILCILLNPHLVAIWSGVDPSCVATLTSHFPSWARHCTISRPLCLLLYKALCTLHNIYIYIYMILPSALA